MPFTPGEFKGKVEGDDWHYKYPKEWITQYQKLGKTGKELEDFAVREFNHANKWISGFHFKGNKGKRNL